MNNELFENTKIVAYFLWEYTQCESALGLWYCAEELGCYFDRNHYYTQEDIQAIRMKGVYNYAYIQFVRNISYFLHTATGQVDSKKNWYTAEALIQNYEWCAAITKVAGIYNTEKDKSDFIAGIRSDKIKNYYKTHI